MLALHAVAALPLLLSFTLAEKHTLRFDNKCSFGTPTLIQGGKVLSTGKDYTHDGPFYAGIAYLQTGDCLFNGENCTILEISLGNPTGNGGASSVDISLIPTHAFSVTTGFSYYGGCDGRGAICDHPACNTAFFIPDDNQVQVQCEAENVNLLMTFCGDGNAATTDANAPSSAATTKAPAHTSTKVAVTQAATTSAAPTTSLISATSTSPASTGPAVAVNRKMCREQTVQKRHIHKGVSRRRRFSH